MAANKRSTTKKSGKAQSKKSRRTASAGKGGSAKSSKAKKFDKVWEVIRKHEDRLRRIEGVDDIRPGYRVKNGWFAGDDPVIVVEVSQKLDAKRVPKDQKIPRSIEGIPVDVTPTPPSKKLRARGVEADAAGVSGAIASLSQDLALPGWDRESGGEADKGEADEGEAEADSNLIPYKPPPGATLKEFRDAMTVTCHVSPDAGWATLRKFFQSVKKTLTIGMYDFTAPHILDGLESAMANATGKLSLILDPKESLGGGSKAKDVPEEEVRSQLSDALPERFDFVWAAVGRKKVTGAIFPSAYHIKVAVSGGRSFWLSSGNWQSSNQPNLEELDLPIKKILTKYNREWHVVISHQGLAATYEKYLKGDIKQAKPLQLEEDASQDVSADQPAPVIETLIPASVLAEIEADIEEPRFFEPEEFKFTKDKPLRVQPLLTPDNFAENVLKVVKSAKKTLYFQNQYIKVSKKENEMFFALLDALLEKTQAGLDVKIILRDIGDTRGMLEALIYYGFDESLFKVQPGCHTKGIVVDSKVVVLGSHNWSLDGTTRNRDASLIFFNSKIARYYEKTFLYDWDNLARQKIVSEDAVAIVRGEEDALGVEADTSNLTYVPWDFAEDVTP